MNKLTYVCVMVVLTCLLLVTGTWTFLHYHFNYSTEEWFKESIQDGDYVIVGKEIGDTILDGQTRVKIYIYDHVNGECMTSFETRVGNKGKKLTADNYRIEYNEEYIKIVLIEFDHQTCVAYCFFFEDFKY